MKKIWIIGLVVLAIILIVFFAFRFFSNNNQVPLSQYEASRIAIDNTENNENHPQEVKLGSFSTELLSEDKDRLTNIKITCSRINETVVKSGKEFSFCDVVGNPKSEDGYKKANAFGADGEIIQAIGGGNCQVSTTIYNAVLKVDGLKVTERHEHDRDVAYIQDGKDATVAYDYLDLKFENNNNFDIKLYAYVNDDKVTVEVFKVI